MTTPIIRVDMLAGRTPEQKRELIKELTMATSRVLGSPPERVRVVLNEVPRSHFGIGGVPADEIPGR